MMPISIDALLAGKTDPRFAARGSSAIANRPVTGRRRVTFLGIDGDEQADLSVHGGVDKAIHHYARDHYSGWAAEIGTRPLLEQAGAFGENVSTTGLTESEVCLGDRFRMGTALVEVAQGRQPCWKQAHHLGEPTMIARMVRSGRTGWYYRVIEEGEVGAGDDLTLLERPFSDWPVSRLFSLLIAGKHQGEEGALRELERHPVLAEEWRWRARRLLS